MRSTVILVSIALFRDLEAAAHHVCAIANEGFEAIFDCGGDLISAVDFASYGSPRGTVSVPSNPALPVRVPSKDSRINLPTRSPWLDSPWYPLDVLAVPVSV